MKFWKRKSAPSAAPAPGSQGPGDPAVLVHLDAVGLPEETYDAYDVGTLEDRLEEAISSAEAGEFDGNEFGPEEVVLFMYGPDAERLFTVVEPVLRDYPLCRGAKVRIRSGGPGSPERELRLPPG